MPAASWLGRFTRAHPSVRVDVLDRLEMDAQETLFSVRVTPGRPGGWHAELAALPGVHRVEALREDADEAVLRVFFEGATFLPLLRSHGLVRQFPFPVQNGDARWTVVGPAAKVRALAARLRRDPGVRLEAIGPGLAAESRPWLTARQREVLRHAVTSGYFEVPRRVTLSQLARQIGVAPSTLSVTLATVERKVLERDQHGR